MNSLTTKRRGEVLSQQIQVLLECSVCVGAYCLWIDSLSFITVTYLIFCCAASAILNFRKITFAKISFCWFIYVFYVIVNTVQSSDYLKSLQFTKMLIAMCIMVIVFSSVKCNSKIQLSCIIIVSFLISLSIIWEFLHFKSFQGLAKTLFSEEAYITISMLKGSFDRYVGFAVYAGPASCLILYGICAQFVYQKKDAKFYVAFAINVIAILLTGSRTLLLLVVLVSIVYRVVLLRKTLRKTTRRRLYQLLLLSVIMGFAVMYFIVRYGDSLRLFNGTLSFSSLYTRASLYSLAIDLFCSEPFFGTGLNTYLIYSTNASHLTNTYTHNLLLQSLAEQGIIGSFIFFTVIIGTLIYTMKKWKYNKHIKELQFSMLIQVIFLIYSLVGNPFYDLNLRLIYFYGMILGIRTRSKYVVDVIAEDKQCQNK